MGAAGAVGGAGLQGAHRSARPKMGATSVRQAALGCGVPAGACGLGWGDAGAVGDSGLRGGRGSARPSDGAARP